ncbi:MAG: hypothetical protein U1F21_10200 [Sphaerotilus natans]
MPKLTTGRTPVFFLSAMTPSSKPRPPPTFRFSAAVPRWCGHGSCWRGSRLRRERRCLDHHVLAQREQVSGFEAAQLDVAGGVAELDPHVVDGGRATLAGHVAGAGSDEAAALLALRGGVQLDAAALAGTAVGVLVGGVEFDVGIEAHGGESRSGEQGGDGQGGLRLADHGLTPLSLRCGAVIKLDASKGSQKTKRKRMGWSDDYLQGLFGLTPGSVSHAQTSSDG